MDNQPSQAIKNIKKTITNQNEMMEQQAKILKQFEKMHQNHDQNFKKINQSLKTLQENFSSTSNTFKQGQKAPQNVPLQLYKCLCPPCFNALIEKSILQRTCKQCSGYGVTTLICRYDCFCTKCAERLPCIGHIQLMRCINCSK